MNIEIISIRNIHDYYNKEDYKIFGNYLLNNEITILINKKYYLYIQLFNNNKKFYLRSFWSYRILTGKKINENIKIKKIINLFRIGVLKKGLII